MEPGPQIFGTGSENAAIVSFDDKTTNSTGDDDADDIDLDTEPNGDPASPASPATPATPTTPATPAGKPSDAIDSDTFDLSPTEGEDVQTDTRDGMHLVNIRIRRSLANRRLDKYLASRLGKNVTSRTALQKLISGGDVKVNGRKVKRSYTIQSGDSIEMLLPVPEVKTIPPEPIPISVIYEDDDIIAVNKQHGLIVHPARGNWSGTLLNALAWYFQQNNASIGDLPLRDEAFRPGVVHRLDRDTTGIILLAKSERALSCLGKQFENRCIFKTYVAITHGHVELDSDVIDMPIGQHSRVKEKYSVDRRTGRPFSALTKSAVTSYEVIKRLGGNGKPLFTMLELHPKTGRTHQLRVHCSHIGHPIIGDHLYGGGPLYRGQVEGRPDDISEPIITRQALHARHIEFNHPGTNRRMELEAPLPEDYSAAVEALGEMDAAK